MDYLNLLSRRDFLKEAGLLGLVGTATGRAGANPASNKFRIGPLARNPRTLERQSLRSRHHDIQERRSCHEGAAVERPAKLAAQALLHNNKCIHRNWLWLPWHRVYLLYLERICRKLTGDDKFALPYWNWNTHPAVPDPFWDISSPLFDSNRGSTDGPSVSVHRRYQRASGHPQ